MGLIIEGGVSFLLLFTPFAFGGVEMWAKGIFQIVAGIVFAAWVWSRFDVAATRRGTSSSPGKMLAIWISIALFVLLVLLQLAPIPPLWVQRIAPGTHDLYARTLPGYAEGTDFDAARLPAWLVARKGDLFPKTSGTAPAGSLDAPPLSAAGVPTRVSSWRTVSIDPFETWQHLSLLICLIGVFAVVSSWYRTRERLARLMMVTVFAGFALSIVGIIQKLTWNGKLLWVREGHYDNVFGPFVNRNNYAAFAGTVLPIAVCMALGAIGQMEKERPGALPSLLLWGFATVTLCAGIFYSLSRAGILCAALSLGIVAVMIMYYGRGAKQLAVLGVMALAAGGLLIWLGPEKVIERVGTLSDAQNLPSLEGRVGAWKRALDLVGSSPAVGAGLGTFRYAFMRFAPPGEGWWNAAHNEYLELVCDTGLVGGTILLCGSVAWLSLVARPSLFRGRGERYHYIGIVAGIAALLLHSAISSNLQIPANALLLSVLGATLISLVDGASRQRRASRAPERAGAAAGSAPPPEQVPAP